MSARDGMATVIAEMRGMCSLGTADYTVAGVAYWSDDQIAGELDRLRKTVTREALTPVSEYSNGTMEYYDYYWQNGYVEEYDSSNPHIFHLEDSNGSAIGTAAYTVDYEARHIRFDSDTLGSVYYLSYRHYPVYRVASTIWRKKAGHVADRFDIKSDNHDLKASQLRASYMAMADKFAKMAGPQVVRMVRHDVN